MRFWKEVENAQYFPSTKTMVYSFHYTRRRQCGLRFVLKNLRDFSGEEEDFRQLANIKLYRQNLGLNFEVNIVYIFKILDIF